MAFQCTPLGDGETIHNKSLDSFPNLDCRPDLLTVEGMEMREMKMYRARMWESVTLSLVGIGTCVSCSFILILRAPSIK